jgi:BMFP domain-containing protein YqiC
MQTKNKLLDDISQIMNSAMGVAQGARDEAQNALRSVVDRMLADRNLVTREEFEAVRAMAQKAREENDALAARLATLEGQVRVSSTASASEPSAGPTTPSL